LAHSLLPLPVGFILAPGTPFKLLKSGEKRKILVYLSELKSFNNLIQDADKVIFNE